MDLATLMEEIRSLHLKLDGVTKTIEKNTKTLSTLEKKVNDIDELQRIGSETVRKSANSINTIIRFLAGLRKLTPTELKNTLVRDDAILNTVHPIPTERNIDEPFEWDVTKNNLRNILKEVFDLLSSMPLDTNNTNHSVASTSHSCGKVEDDKIHIWRKYKNRYNYIEKLKPKLAPLSDPVVSLQEDVNPIVENVENDVNKTVKNNLNGDTHYSINDVIQKREVYEMFKRSLKNSPYEDSFYQNKDVYSKLTFKLKDGSTYEKPVSHVAPLIVLKKCDDLICPIQPQNKKTKDENFQSTSKYINDSSSYNTTANPDEHFQSTSNSINDSNSNNLTAKTDERETRDNKTEDITNSFNTNGKTTTKKRRSTIKTSKYEPSKKRKQ